MLNIVRLKLDVLILKNLVNFDKTVEFSTVFNGEKLFKNWIRELSNKSYIVEEPYVKEVFEIKTPSEDRLLKIIIKSSDEMTTKKRENNYDSFMKIKLTLLK